jgi:carboxyl-terminal processing protease
VFPRAAAIKRAAAGTILLFALASTSARGQSPEGKPPLDDASWSLFQRIFGMVLRDYVEPKTPQEVVLGALKGAASSAGPECSYIPPEEVAAYRAAGSAPATLPLYITKDSDFAKVLAVYPGQDAAIRVGDSLRFIGNRSTYDLTYPQVLETLRGAEGEKIRCIFLKQESWQSYTVVLSRQGPAAPRWIPLGSGSGALVLPCLESPLPSDVAEGLRGAKGPVLVDLRACASGDVRAASMWAGDLLGKAQGPSRKGSKGISREPLSGPGYLAGKAVKVLVDETTARGGEVLAIALVEGGGILAGAPTFGWAPYFQDFPLENAGLLRLSTAFFLDPGGEPLKGHPMAPAIPLKFQVEAKPEENYRQAIRARVPTPILPSQAAIEAPQGFSKGESGVKKDGQGKRDAP